MPEEIEHAQAELRPEASPKTPLVERGDGYGWLLALGVVFLAAHAALGAAGSGSFADMLGTLLLGLALLCTATYLYVVIVRRRTAGGPWARRFLLLTLGALVAFVAGAILHNVIAGLTGFEEPVFFLVAVLLAPLALLVGTLGAVIATIAHLHGAGRERR